MAKVFVDAVVSVDGYVADDNDEVGPLFAWFGNGDVAVTWSDDDPDPDHVLHVSQASADYIANEVGNVGAVVVGRRSFDLTNGWDGVPPAGDHMFVVTHEAPTDWPFPDAPFTFVTDGVASAVEQAKAIAGDRTVSVSAGDIGGQALAAGVVDEVHMNVVPVVFGSGRTFFAGYEGGKLLLEDPRIIQGDRVAHHIYPVRKE
jgi:dihydrofolate reductase